jgi:type I restriction enzyme, S subunit
MNQASTITNSQLKEGYKQTEVGVIPEDWKCVELDQLNPFITSGSRGWADFYSEYGDPFVRITNMFRESISLDLQDLRYVNLPIGANEGKRTQLSDGDLLISITADIGIISYVDERLQKPAYINQHIALVRFDKEKINSQFISYFLSHESSQKWFRGGTDQGAKAGMSLITVRKIKTAIPPLAEQEAIACTLSDIDALIESLDRLLTKKRQIKQGAMQELLRSKDGWVVKRLGEICEIGMGRTPPRLNGAFWGKGYKWLSIADLKSKVVNESKEEITSLAAADMKIIPKGTLLMSFKLSLGRLCFAGCDLFTNEAICSFNQLQANAEFLYYILGRTDFSLYGKQAVKGYTLNKESLNLIEVSLPSIPEQIEIANILSDMDAEIDSISAKLTKTRQLKQGMMHELLTGRIRLVKSVNHD